MRLTFCDAYYATSACPQYMCFMFFPLHHIKTSLNAQKSHTKFSKLAKNLQVIEWVLWMFPSWVPTTVLNNTAKQRVENWQRRTHGQTISPGVSFDPFSLLVCHRQRLMSNMQTSKKLRISTTNMEILSVLCYQITQTRVKLKMYSLKPSE